MAVPPRYKATTTVRANNMRTAKSFGFFSRNNLLVKLAVKYCKPLATQFRLWCPVQFFFLRSVPLKERFDGRRALAARKSQGHQGVLQGYNVQCVPVYLYTLSMLIYFTHRVVCFLWGLEVKGCSMACRFFDAVKRYVSWYWSVSSWFVSVYHFGPPQSRRWKASRPPGMPTSKPNFDVCAYAGVV